MNILIEIGHPAHVHFFARPIARLRALGHSIHVITRNKDITDALLKKMGISYESLSLPAKGKAAMLMELFLRWGRTLSRLRRHHIDLAVSISGITTSLPARMYGIPNIIFTDTEDARLSNRIAFPFASVIYTPEFFLENLKGRHRRYHGLHELAYLQDFNFSRGAELRRTFGLPEKYFIIRSVSNDALHDNESWKLTPEQFDHLVSLLSPYGKVFLSQEGILPANRNAYRLETPVEHIHAVLAGAQAFIGDSPTMAVESSLLGTPAFLVSRRSHGLGNMVHLEKDHRLLVNVTAWDQIPARLAAQGDLAALKIDWSLRATHFRKTMPKMEEFITDAILEGLEKCAA